MDCAATVGEVVVLNNTFDNMQEISAAEVMARLDAGEQFHLLDVREPDEYKEFNLGGKLLPLGQILSLQLDEIEDWKDEEVVVHCRSGVRSVQAAMMLEAAGFTTVKNMTGGVLALGK